MKHKTNFIWKITIETQKYETQIQFQFRSNSIYVKIRNI